MPFVLGIRFENHTPFDFNGGRGTLSLRARKWLDEIQTRTMFGVAKKWFEQVFPQHFQVGNKSRYQFEKRNVGYLLQTKVEEGVGKGKNPNVFDVLTGESERAMVHIPPRITGNKNKVTVKMHNPPSYFRNPFVGTIDVDKTIRTRDGSIKDLRRTVTISRQPDKVAEVLHISSGDDQMLRRFAAESSKPAVKAANRKLKTQIKTIK